MTPSARPYTVKQPSAGIPAANGFSVLGDKRQFRVFSDDSGRWQVDLVRGISVRVMIRDVGYDQGFKVPEDRDTLNIVDAYIYRSESRFDGGATHPWSQGPQLVS